jgi:hypothetical protein
MPEFRVELKKNYRKNGSILVNIDNPNATENDALELVQDMMCDKNTPLKTEDSRIEWDDYLDYEDDSFDTTGFAEGLDSFRV